MSGLPRGTLTRELLVRESLRLLDKDGVAGFSLPKLGRALGADPTAVYRHFRNKREMLSELANRLFATEPELDPASPWQERLRAWVWHAMRRYRNHLDLGLLLAGQTDELPSLVRIRERSLGLLTEAGLSLKQAALFSQVLENHVVGCGLFFAVSGWHSCPPHESLEATRRFYTMLPADIAPLTREAAPHLCPEPDDVYAYTTDLLIAAIERIAATEGEEVARA